MDAKQDAKHVNAGVFDFGPRPSAEDLKQAEARWQANIAALGECAECGQPPLSEGVGPVHSQLDLPSGQHVKRCPECWRKIQSGEVTTKVDDSPVSLYFAAERAVMAARAAKAKAEADGDEPMATVHAATVARNVAIMARIHADVSDAIARAHEGSDAR